MSLLILVVDDEPDVEVLFRQQFRRDIRSDRFTMEFAQSAPMALQRITDAADHSLILILSDINMPGMSGSRFGWAASKTLEVAQELYDGQGKKIIRAPRCVTCHRA